MVAMQDRSNLIFKQHSIQSMSHKTSNIKAWSWKKMESMKKESLLAIRRVKEIC